MTDAELSVVSGSRNVLGHPIGLFVLCGTEMWERFCYYGMRALLTFYMVDFLFQGNQPNDVIGYPALKGALQAIHGPLSPQALTALVYGFYTGFIYLTPLAGGAIADRLIGQGCAVVLGALTMATGEFLLMNPNLFLIGLIVLAIGSGFIKPNVSTQVGGLYCDGDSRMDRAYSIFYLGINLGALLAPVICGRLGHALPGKAPHWHYGFAAAGVGVLVGLVIYLVGAKYLPPDPRRRQQEAARQNVSPPNSGARFDVRDRKAIAALLMVAFCNVFFWAGYEQQGITIALLAQNDTDLKTIFGTLRPEDVQSFSALFIILFTPLVIGFWGWQSRMVREPPPVIKMAIGCVFLAVANAVMLIPAAAADHGEKISVLWLFFSTGLVTVGELYLSPVGLSLFSRAAPVRVASLMMGVNFLSNFAGNILAGYLGSYWEKMPHTTFFALIATIAALAAIAIFILGRLLGSAVEGRTVLVPA